MAEQTRIKPDPEAGSPGVEDELDESTDLEFYNRHNDAYNRMYLARLPNYLWNAWSELGDDEEIRIGTIRQWKGADGQWKIQMRLQQDIKQHRNLPKEYNMEIANPDVNNTFVFTEQDLPSYAAKNKERAAALAQGIPAHLLRAQQIKSESQPADRSRRGAPYVRRAIPKKTAIAGTIKHEVVCTPVQNAETDYLLGMSALEKQAPKKEVQIEGRLPQGGQQQTEWTDFLKTHEGKPSKAKRMDTKTARWPENQLLDEIARCFSTHKYWSIKAFRSRIPQPEAFIRECLEKIAVLNRSGTYANHWSLKPEYQGMMANKNLPEPANDAAAAKPSGDLDSEEDEEDVKMEDVLF